MARQAPQKKIEKFIRDVIKLREEFPNRFIAQKLNIDAANLSSYITGAKNPGQETINKFYEVFEKQTRNFNNEPVDAAEQPLSEAQLRSMLNEKTEHMDTLKTDKESFRVNHDKLVDTNQTMARTIQTMAESFKTLARSNFIMAKNNQALVNRIVLKRFPGKRSKPN